MSMRRYWALNTANLVTGKKELTFWNNERFRKYFCWKRFIFMRYSSLPIYIYVVYINIAKDVTIRKKIFFINMIIYRKRQSYIADAGLEMSHSTRSKCLCFGSGGPYRRDPVGQTDRSFCWAARLELLFYLGRFST